MEAGNPLLDDYVLSLSSRARPRVCFLPTASGDADHYLVRFYQAFGADRCEPSHLSLFRRDRHARDPRALILDADVVYVGGGSVLSMLGAWRAHGVDALLREAWERGVVLCGVSAGALCWFAEGLTTFNGPPAAFAGLGLLPFSGTVHHQSRAEGCADAYRLALREGMSAGYAVEDGVALHFRGERLHRAVSSRPHARAFRMRRVGGRVARKPLRVSFLGTGAEPAPPPLEVAAPPSSQAATAAVAR
jgi:peptidase E